MKYYCDDWRHLVCIPYNVENLHKMAEDLNIKRCWFHNPKPHGRYAHYDIPKGRVEDVMADERVEVKSVREVHRIIVDKIQHEDELNQLNLRI